MKQRRILSSTIFMFVVLALFTPIYFAHAETKWNLWDFVIPGKALVKAGGYVAGVGGDALWNEVLLGLANFILSTGAFVLGIAGTFLEAALSYSVINMSHMISAQGQFGTIISKIWVVFRDVANMFFIFILLYAAICTILDYGGVNLKKTLRNVILVAIFLNFSLFFTKTLVDVSNILTITFYNRITAESRINIATDPKTAAIAGGISGAFMTKLGITTLYDTQLAASDPNSSVAKIAGDGWAMLKLALFGSIFMLVAAFVFGAVAILFVIRFVNLLFIFILSPLAFAAMALPKDQWSSRWWKSLWKQLIFAPVCFIMLWASLQMLDGVTATLGAPDLQATILGGGVGGAAGTALVNSGANTVLVFVIVIAFLIGTLIIANEMGAQGAGAALKIGKKWRGNLQGFVGRGAVRVGLGTLQGAAKITRADKVFTEEFGKTKVGRGLKSVTTDALKNMDFGSGQSVSKVDKEIKKRNEDYVKEVEKGLEKGLDKKLPELRKKRVTEIDSRVSTIDTDLEQAKKEKIRLETELANAKTSPMVLPAKITEYEQKIIQQATKIESLPKEKTKLVNEKTGLEERMVNNNVATKDEKQMWLRPLQLEKAEALDPKAKPTNRIGKIGRAIADFTRPAEKKMAAKKLRENARGGGGKDVKATLQELLDESGEAPEKPKGGDDKKKE